MSEVSTFRLYLLRAAYLLIVVGLALMIWPGILSHSAELPHMNGVVRSLLGAVCLLSVIGLFHPLRMLPILLFELVWKTIWLLAFYFPAWHAGTLNADMDGSFFDCTFGVILVLIVTPWTHVYRHYLKPTRSRPLAP